VRMRWYTSLGMSIETLETIDASRDGLLVARAKPCPPGSRLWVTFPFDSAPNAGVQPETRARVLRVQPHDSGASVAIALRFDRPVAAARREGEERRRAPRVALALPILVRSAGAPWAQECMTDDISRSGVRFETPQVFAPGNDLHATIPWGELAECGEMSGRVVRVQALAGAGFASPAGPFGGSAGTLTSVAVRWDRAQRP